MSYKFFQNKECEYFPCHAIGQEEEFNCLFCFCPLYFKGDACGGNFIMLQDGTKDCGGCVLPHKKDSGYDRIIEILKKKG